jgi:hypothetical protein
MKRKYPQLPLEVEILRKLNGIKCPTDECEGELGAGMMSKRWQLPAMFCVDCGYRLSLIMIESHRKGDDPEFGWVRLIGHE